MNYYSLGDMDSAFAGMWDAETLQDVAIAAGVGGVTSLVTGKVVNGLGEMIYPKKKPEETPYTTDEVTTQQYVKGGIAAVLGFLGAAFIHQYNRPAAFAFAGSMAGEGLAKMVRQAAGAKSTDDPLWASYQLRGGRGMNALRATTVELERALRGGHALAAPVVTAATRQNGLATSIPRKFQSFMGA